MAVIEAQPQTMTGDGQIYRQSGTLPYTKKDGSQTTLLVWETARPTCGASFQVTTNLAIARLRRRCDLCRKPGRTVKRENKVLQRKARRLAVKAEREAMISLRPQT